MIAENRIGLKFGLLTVVGRSDVTNKNGIKKWIVKCSCGNFKDVEFSSLKNGLTKSCGCLSRRLAGERFKDFNESQFGIDNLKKMHESNKGKKMPEGPNFAGPNNIHAKYWCFKNNEGGFIRGINLNDLIRSNSSLFNEEDIIERAKKDGTKYTRAACGLRGLGYVLKNGKTPSSWKGWVLVEKGDY